MHAVPAWHKARGRRISMCVALPPTHIGGCTLYVGRSTMDEILWSDGPIYRWFCRFASEVKTCFSTSVSSWVPAGCLLDDVRCVWCKSRVRFRGFGVFWGALGAASVCFGYVLGALGCLGELLGPLGGEMATGGDHCGAMGALWWVLGCLWDPFGLLLGRL